MLLGVYVAKKEVFLMMRLTCTADDLGSDSDAASLLIACMCYIIAIFTCRYSGLTTSVAEESERADFFCYQVLILGAGQLTKCFETCRS